MPFPISFCAEKCAIFFDLFCLHNSVENSVETVKNLAFQALSQVAARLWKVLRNNISGEKTVFGREKAEKLPEWARCLNLCVDCDTITTY